MNYTGEAVLGTSTIAMGGLALTGAYSTLIFFLGIVLISLGIFTLLFYLTMRQKSRN